MLRPRVYLTVVPRVVGPPRLVEGDSVGEQEQRHRRPTPAQPRSLHGHKRLAVHTGVLVKFESYKGRNKTEVILRPFVGKCSLFVGVWAVSIEVDSFFLFSRSLDRQAVFPREKKMPIL